MKENIEQMRKRHEGEIQVLQKGCLHGKVSEWVDWCWAPGHFSGKVRVCKRCGKVVKQDKGPGPVLQSPIDNPPGRLSEKELKAVTKALEGLK